jgi:hypothetical protein
MKTLVLEIKRGGLGDHLFYSHIPRIAKETKAFENVLISNRSIFRNQDYKKLIWEFNPFVDGFTDKEGISKFPGKIEKNENLLDRLMILYGLEDGNRFHEPEIYYQSIKNDALKEKTIYDPNYISYVGDLKNAKPIESWLEKNNIQIDYQMKVLSARNLPIANLHSFETPTIFEFCSALVSCKRLFCLTTGTATLAAALNIPATVFHGNGQPSMYHHSNLHQYINVGSNYTFSDKIKKQTILLLQKLVRIGTP